MAERSQNLQDLFLNTVRKQKISLTIFLINGVKLTGVVTSFDNFCVLSETRWSFAACLQACDLHHHAEPACADV
jgi:RNA chaperone Hfq